MQVWQISVALVLSAAQVSVLCGGISAGRDDGPTTQVNGSVHQETVLGRFTVGCTGPLIAELPAERVAHGGCGPGDHEQQHNGSSDGIICRRRRRSPSRDCHRSRSRSYDRHSRRDSYDRYDRCGAGALCDALSDTCLACRQVGVWPPGARQGLGFREWGAGQVKGFLVHGCAVDPGAVRQSREWWGGGAGGGSPGRGPGLEAGAPAPARVTATAAARRHGCAAHPPSPAAAATVIARRPDDGRHSALQSPTAYIRAVDLLRTC